MTLNTQHPAMDEGRLQVIDNIEKALKRGDTFSKVELHDPVITDEDIKRVIYPFDNTRSKMTNKLLSFVARKVAERETKARNTLTTIVGLENALGIEGGALITCNHFSIMDNTIVRLLAEKCGKGKKFNIVVQQTNVFMDGYFGFLMRHCKTMPVSDSAVYMAKNFKPALRELLSKDEFVLIYPEQEMWFNYKKPRELREGAYYYAAEFGVPVIPCFVTMENLDEYDEQGFLKVKHTLHVMPPIYPDKELPARECRAKMQSEDLALKRGCYERVYGIPLDDNFIPERDIAGYHK